MDPENYQKRWEDLLRTKLPKLLADTFKGQHEGAQEFNGSLAKEFADKARANNEGKGLSEAEQTKAILEALAEGERADGQVAAAAKQAEEQARAAARAEGKSTAEIDRAGKDARVATEAAHKDAQRRNERERQSTTNDPAPDSTRLRRPPRPRPRLPRRRPSPAPPAAENTDEAIDRANKARQDALDNNATPEEADQAYADGLSGQPPRPLTPREPSGPSETDVKVNRAQRAHDEAIANGATPEEANQAYVDALLFL